MTLIYRCNHLFYKIFFGIGAQPIDSPELELPFFFPIQYVIEVSPFSEREVDFISVTYWYASGASDGPGMVRIAASA